MHWGSGAVEHWSQLSPQSTALDPSGAMGTGLNGSQSPARLLRCIAAILSGKSLVVGSRPLCTVPTYVQFVPRMGVRQAPAVLPDTRVLYINQRFFRNAMSESGGL